MTANRVDAQGVGDGGDVGGRRRHVPARAAGSTRRSRAGRRTPSGCRARPAAGNRGSGGAPSVRRAVVPEHGEAGVGTVRARRRTRAACARRPAPDRSPSPPAEHRARSAVTTTSRPRRPACALRPPRARAPRSRIPGTWSTPIQGAGTLARRWPAGSRPGGAEDMGAEAATLPATTPRGSTPGSPSRSSGSGSASSTRRRELAGPPGMGPATERLGFDSFWIEDHPMLAPIDCWTTLAALAVHTERLRLGPLVSCVYYRPAGPPGPHGRGRRPAERWPARPRPRRRRHPQGVRPARAGRAAVPGAGGGAGRDGRPGAAGCGPGRRSRCAVRTSGPTTPAWPRARCRPRTCPC